MTRAATAASVAEPSQGPRLLQAGHLPSPRAAPQRAPAEPQVQRCADQRQHEQHVVECRALAEGKLLERKVVGPGRYQLGGVGRAPSGQTDHEVEHLHGEYEPEEQRDLDNRQDDRHDDETEPLPGAGAVDDRRFLDLHRHVLERAVEQEGEEGYPEPDVGDEDRPEGQVRVVQPLDRVVDEAEVHEHLVDGSTFGLEQEPEDDPGHDQRQQPGDDDERARKRPPREPEAEKQRERKADDELEDER